MLKIRRIKTDKFKTAAFWIEKRDNEYIACRTLVNALLGIASPAAGVEIFAHELAHVATPEDREHGGAWKAAFDRIFEEYNRIAQDLFGEGGEEPC